MKKNKFITNLLAASLLVSLVTPAALAAEVNRLETEGEVTFKLREDPEGEIVEPDEEDKPGTEIEVPGGGESGKGLLRIQFVPHFKFVDVEGVTAGKIEKNVKVLAYKEKGNDLIQRKIAPFVQVSDERGIVGDGAKWDLKVNASKFVANKGAANEHTLDHAFIRLNDSTLTMTHGTSTGAGNLVQGQSNAAGVVGAVDLEPGQAYSVLKTLPGKDTNGYQVSNVFQEDYQQGMIYPGNQTNGVTFVKPAGQAAIADAQYKATLTWTLTDGI